MCSDFSDRFTRTVFEFTDQNGRDMSYDEMCRNVMKCVEMSWNVMKCHNVINVLETCSLGPLFCPRQTPEVITQTKRHWEVSRAGHWYSFSDAMGPTAFVEIWFCKSLLHLRFDDPVFLDHPFFAQNLRRPVFSNHYVAFPKEVQPGHSFRARRIGKHHL